MPQRFQFMCTLYRRLPDIFGGGWQCVTDLIDAQDEQSAATLMLQRIKVPKWTDAMLFTRKVG